MLIRACAVLALATLATQAIAKGPQKGALPASVLHARTAAVIVDPDAGVVLTDPQANQVAQRDVEQALQNWGRFTPVLSTQGADLIIVVRRGHGKVVQPTIYDPRQNSRDGTVIPGDDGITLGAQHGRNPLQQAGSLPVAGEAPGARVEAGTPEDVFAVYPHDPQDTTDPLDAPPAWRYIAKDGLKPHTVPAVDAFRKALAVADKLAASHP